jgi:transcriptional regulator with XRE-family HTH domain
MRGRMTVGEKIKELRKELRISQKELGNLLNVAQQVVSYYEKSGNIDASKLAHISKSYNVDIRFFFDEKPLNSYKTTVMSPNSAAGYSIPAGWDDILEKTSELDFDKVKIIEAVVRALIKEFSV